MLFQHIFIVPDGVDRHYIRTGRDLEPTFTSYIFISLSLLAHKYKQICVVKPSLKMIAIVYLALMAFVMPSLAQITDSQKIQILNVFNQARRTTVLPAANMKIMEWDDGLAQQAQAFTDACQPVWHPLKGAFFAYWDRMPDPVAVAKFRTLRMAPYFDYYTGGCINTPQSNATCRHPENYESIVLATNERVGCGMTYCWPADGPKARFHACAIGNVAGASSKPKYPWTLGTPCSACPTGWNYCLNGLCSKFPGTSQPSQAPVTSKRSQAPTKYPTRNPGTTKSPTRRKRRG